MIDAHQLRRLAASGLTTDELAARLGVGRDTVIGACYRHQITRVDVRRIPDRERVLWLVAQGATICEIAERLGHHRVTIARILRAHGVAPNSPTTRRCRDRDDQIERLARAGLNRARIAQELGCSERVVQGVLRTRRLIDPPPPPYTPQELAQAEAMLADGCSIAEIDRTLGRSMSNRLRGRGWSHQQIVEHAVAVRQHGRRMAKAQASYAAGRSAS